MMNDIGMLGRKRSEKHIQDGKYLKGISSDRTITGCGDDSIGERFLEEVVVRVEIEVEAVSLGSIRHGRSKGYSENGAMGERRLSERTLRL
jgi:hypothetical protein